ncbi:MAG: protein kinase [Myxococcales bacterium]|nr:protein kinase [Myxococcales bacterium]
MKVLDFGTATSACELTATHAFIGTPLYMAPEQTVSAREADARADIWSLGAILYELLTGSSPFDGTTVFHVLMAVREWTPTPLSELRSDVPRELEAVVFACLEKDREARISSARELALRLAPFASSARARGEARAPLPTPPLPTPDRSARARRRGAAYAAALLLGAFGVGAAGAAAARQHSIPPATAVPSVATTHEAGLSGRATALPPPVSLTVRAAVPGSS